MGCALQNPISLPVAPSPLRLLSPLKGEELLQMPWQLFMFRLLIISTSLHY